MSTPLTFGFSTLLRRFQWTFNRRFVSTGHRSCVQDLGTEKRRNIILLSFLKISLVTTFHIALRSLTPHLIPSYRMVLYHQYPRLKGTIIFNKL